MKHILVLFFLASVAACGTDASTGDTPSTDGTTATDSTTATDGVAGTDGTTVTDDTSAADGVTEADGLTAADGVTGTDGTIEADGTTESDGATDTDASTATDGSDATDAPVVPLIADTEPPCDGSTKGPSAGVTPGPDLHRFVLDSYPNALCNDGTPAVMYIRAASSDLFNGAWLFHFQGGSGCRDYETCRARWCGTGAPYHAGKMSSAWTVESMKGTGIMKRREGNPVANAHQVYIYYCSSDGHSGRKSDVVYTSAADPTEQLRLHHRGHDIIAAVMDQLLSGPTTSDDGEETVPNINTAQRVLVTGTSAGSNGVATNLDYIAERLPSEVKVSGVFDAGVGPLLDFVDDEQIKAAMEARIDWDTAQANMNAFVDESCLAANGDDPGVCLELTNVRLNYTATPFFIRMDLADSVTMKGWTSVNPDVPLAKRSGWIRKTLLSFKDIMTESSEAVTRLPGIYGPGCGQHVGITNEEWYDGATVEDPTGTPTTMRAALWSWLNDEDVFILDTIPPTLSDCATTNNARD